MAKTQVIKEIPLKGNHKIVIKGNQIFVDGIKLDVHTYGTTDLNKLEQLIKQNETEIIHAIEVLKSLKKLIEDEKDKIKGYQEKLKEMILNTKPISLFNFSSTKVCSHVDYSESWVKFLAEHFRVFINSDYNISCYVSKVSEKIGEVRMDVSIGVIQNKNHVHIELNKFTVLHLENVPIEQVLSFFNEISENKDKLSEVIGLMNNVYKYFWSKDKFTLTYYELGGVFIDIIDHSYRDEQEEEPEYVENDEDTPVE
ncbi:hypothetical protein [Acidianus bottle-shaped virus 3 strain ABV3]|uniref:Uncharacterized protein n=1 Tax=Acidianus bottle-shaped virus 3 strain ABV3 TaxID=1732174 RepID=A0A0N9PCQ1_9VIRU|nr:hypothetical protein AVU00_gp24 [Acidianus bottle-shaped virus 3 strain ABV3]ALG96826.1 hypothetical protein [Acidianus bottle-shaped virus 3 strain ABV3]